MSGPEPRAGGPVADDRARVLDEDVVAGVAEVIRDLQRVGTHPVTQARAVLMHAYAALPTPAPEADVVRCWRSECRNGCYYPDVCSETAPAGEDATLTDWLAAELRRHSPLTFTQARDAAERIAPGPTQRGAADQATLAAEDLAHAFYIDRAHDLDRYPWEDVTANGEFKRRYRAEAERVIRHLAALDGPDAGGGRRG